MLSSVRSARVHAAQFRHATKERCPYIKYHMNPSNTREWYIIISGVSGNNDEYAGGEYLVRLRLPGNFPADPPDFFFMTPNGVYGVEVKVCISIGSYHKGNYPSTIGVRGFCEQLVSGMIGWKELGGGIELVQTSAAQKATIAANSADFNSANHQQIIDTVFGSYIEYSANWAPSV